MRDERLLDVFGLDGKTALITGGGTGLGLPWQRHSYWQEQRW